MGTNKEIETDTIDKGLSSSPGVDSVRGSTELGRTNESIITMDTVESVEDSIVSDIDLGMSGNANLNLRDSMNVASSTELAEQRADELERRASEILSADDHNGMISPAPTHAGGQGLIGSPSPFRGLADSNDNDISNEDETLNFSTSTA